MSLWFSVGGLFARQDGNLFMRKDIGPLQRVVCPAPAPPSPPPPFALYVRDTPHGDTELVIPTGKGGGHVVAPLTEDAASRLVADLAGWLDRQRQARRRGHVPAR